MWRRIDCRASPSALIAGGGGGRGGALCCRRPPQPRRSLRDHPRRRPLSLRYNTQFRASVHLPRCFAATASPCVVLDDPESSLEGRIEQAIYKCRFLAFLGIAGSLMGSILCFLKGCNFVMESFREYHIGSGGKVTLSLFEAIDTYLLGTVMFVFAVGLYELFISNLDNATSNSTCKSGVVGLFQLLERPRWLKITSVSELKTKLGHVIVTVLLVGLLEKSKKVAISTTADLFCFSACILVSSVCLYLLSRLQTPAKKQERKHVF